MDDETQQDWERRGQYLKMRIVSGITLILLLLSMLTLAFNIQTVKAETIHWGSGVVKESEYFNFGMGDIFWSIANEERGYFYGSSSSGTVFFADKIDYYWGPYDSYEGIQNIWEFINASEHEWFTQHSIIFSEETSPYYTGILLIRRGDLYGAIKPKSIHNGDLNHPEDYVLEYDWWYDDSGGSDFSSLEPPPPKIETTIDIDPNTLNLRSRGKWISASIELPESYDVRNIDVSTILLNDVVTAQRSKVCGNRMKASFDRSSVTTLLPQIGETELTVTGALFDGTPFEGSDTIRVR